MVRCARKKQWAYHFSNKIIILGVLVGFAGVFMLFSGTGSVSISGNRMQMISFGVLIVSTICWAVGSMYSKYKPVEGSTYNVSRYSNANCRYIVIRCCFDVK